MNLRRSWLLAIIALLTIMFAAACGDDEDGSEATGSDDTPSADAEPTQASGDIIMATTTSTQDSGLLDVLVPMFEEETGWTMKPIAVGSGQAIEMGSRGDADVVFAHSPAAEQRMVDDGDGIERTLVMHNDFIIVGPADDPAGAGDAGSIEAAMTAITESESRFISRGDDSGTHALELRLWEDASIDPAGQGWYEETGQGMGATLQVANQTGAYTLTDRGTFLAQEENLDLEVVRDGDGSLLNVYHVIVVNPEKHSRVNADGARAWVAFLVREDVQAIIGEFGVEEFGEPLFFPDAGKPEPTS